MLWSPTTWLELGNDTRGAIVGDVYLSGVFVRPSNASLPMLSEVFQASEIGT